jgi:hypothetical protein
MLPWVFQAEKEGVKMERFTIFIGLKEDPFGTDLCIGACDEREILTNSKIHRVGGLYNEDCVKDGRALGDLLKSKGATGLADVKIRNGCRIRFSNREEVGCNPVSQENLIAFQEAIKSGLGET